MHGAIGCKTCRTLPYFPTQHAGRALRKLASVRLVRAIVEKTRNGVPEEAIVALSQALRARVAPCVPREMCYYTCGRSQTESN